MGQKISAMMINMLKDNDTGVLISITASIIDCSIVYPHLFVNAIPGLFMQLDHENKWLVIKSIHALCTLLNAEKRLYSKLGSKLFNMLKNTNSLSIEAEIHKSIVKFFKSTPILTDKTKDSIKNYLEQADSNLRYFGLLLLKSLLKVNKDMLILYKEKLIKMLSIKDKVIRCISLDILCDNVFLLNTYSAQKIL